MGSDYLQLFATTNSPSEIYLELTSPHYLEAFILYQILLAIPLQNKKLEN